MATEGVFVLTSSGRVASFTYWASGEPNSLNGEEDCVAVPKPSSQYNRKWVDVPCDVTIFSSVCEYRYSTYIPRLWSHYVVISLT